MAKDLLLEIGTEEIPARFMPAALEQLEELADSILNRAGVKFLEKITALGTPRRLLLHVEKVHEKITQIKSGPPLKRALDEQGNYTQAARGFAKSLGITVDDFPPPDILRQVGRLVYTKVLHEEAVKEILAEACQEIIKTFSFPKTMRWGSGDFSFARPIHWIVALFGKEVIEFEVAGIKSGNQSRGHRFLKKEPFQVTSADLDQYKAELKERSVIVDQNKRRELIEDGLIDIVNSVDKDLGLIADLLDEVNYLVEYPNFILGKFDSEYLDLPPDVLRNVLHKHQKYFEVLERSGNLSPFFIVVSNVPDKANIIRSGNERVIRARLADAQFFYNEDKKMGLRSHIEGLKGVVFQKDLGTYYDKKERVKKLLRDLRKIVPLTGNDSVADLYKADLLTEMVQEFPKLQGVMGEHYARLEGEDRWVAQAISEHYLPRYAGDELPKTDLGAALSIADKLDTIVGCFGVGLIPSGSQDPYALRRQALGIINILLHRLGVHYSLSTVNLKSLVKNALTLLEDRINRPGGQILEEVMEFFRQRLHYALTEKGYRYDLAEAALGAGFDEPYKVDKRCEALQALQQEKDWDALAIAFKRVARIIPPGQSFAGPNPDLFEEATEKELWRQFAERKRMVEAMLEIKNYLAALKELAALRPAVDKFFDDVMVMCEDKKLQANRLALLNSIASLFNQLADFSKIVTQAS